jgi:hypothetical protein
MVHFLANFRPTVAAALGGGAAMRPQLILIVAAAVASAWLAPAPLIAGTSGAAASQGTGVATSAPNSPITRMASWPGGVSKNWSGYAGVARAGIKLTYVSAQWRVPAIQNINNTASSMWVGIDGFHNSQLIQTGTEHSKVNGQVLFRAWWEILPANETPLFNVRAGDLMSAYVRDISGNQWQISIRDVTSGQSFVHNFTYRGPGASAEWILERPEFGGKFSTLAHYTPTGFRVAKVGGNFQPPGNPGLVYPSMAIAMNQNGTLVSFPSRPTNGNSFNLAYGHQPAAP